jgi:hypothetical protein
MVSCSFWHVKQHYFSLTLKFVSKIIRATLVEVAYLIYDLKIHCFFVAETLNFTERE